MIIYADTSALVARYTTEAISSAVVGHLKRAERVFTSYLAFPETLAALNRQVREGMLTPGAFQQASSTFLEEWPLYSSMRLDHRLGTEIIRLLRYHPLRGADVAHLACALYLRRRVAEPAQIPYAFLADDRALCRAAVENGLTVLLLTA